MHELRALLADRVDQLEDRPFFRRSPRELTNTLSFILENDYVDLAARVFKLILDHHSGFASRRGVLAQRALAIARDVGDRVLEGKAHRQLARHALIGGETADTDEHVQQLRYALECFEACTQLEEAASCAEELAEALLQYGRADEALEVIEKGRTPEGGMSLIKAKALRLIGDDDEAEQVLRGFVQQPLKSRYHALQQAEGYELLVTMLHEAAGRHEEEAILLEEWEHQDASNTARDKNLRSVREKIWSHRAALLAQQGHGEEALALLHRAVARLAETGNNQPITLQIHLSACRLERELHGAVSDRSFLRAFEAALKDSLPTEREDLLRLGYQRRVKVPGDQLELDRRLFRAARRRYAREGDAVGEFQTYVVEAEEMIQQQLDHDGAMSLLHRAAARLPISEVDPKCGADLLRLSAQCLAKRGNAARAKELIARALHLMPHEDLAGRAGIQIEGAKLLLESGSIAEAGIWIRDLMEMVRCDNDRALNFRKKEEIYHIHRKFQIAIGGNPDEEEDDDE